MCEWQIWYKVQIKVVSCSVQLPRKGATPRWVPGISARDVLGWVVYEWSISLVRAHPPTDAYTQRGHGCLQGECYQSVVSGAVSAQLIQGGLVSVRCCWEHPDTQRRAAADEPCVRQHRGGECRSSKKLQKI